jgi:hypothetical protein
MISIDFLLVGDALDGPEGEILELRDLEHAFSVYGGYLYTATTLATGATGYTLPATPWGEEVAPLGLDSDGAYIPKSLFEFSVNGTALTWTRNGDWDRYEDTDPSVAPDLIFRYPGVPGTTSLLKGVLAAQGVGVRIHTLRIGGEIASVTSSGWTFTAKHPGARYNGTVVTVEDGVVTVEPAPGTGRVRVYEPDSDAHLWELLSRDMDREWQPLYFSGPLSTTALTLPEATYTLAGGTNGSLTPALFADWLETYDLTGIDVVCPVGFTTEDVRDTGVLDILAAGGYPTLLVAQATTTGAALSGVTHTEENLVSVAFKVRYDTGTAYERTDDGAPMAAALIASRLHGITLAPLPQGRSYPRLTQDELHAVTSAGHLCAYQSISKGEALWYGVTGDTEWPISVYRSLQEVARILYEVLEPHLGQNLVSLTEIEAQLANPLARARGGVVHNWSLRQQNQSLIADVEFIPYGEVRVVKATIALGVTG